MSTQDRIRRFMSETFFVDSFGEDDSFLQTGLIDSTGMHELIAYVQDAFEIVIEDSELLPENLDSLRQLTQFIEKKRQTMLVAG